MSHVTIPLMTSLVHFRQAEELRIWSISVLSTTHGPDHALVLEEKEKLVDSLMAQDKVCLHTFFALDQIFLVGIHP
jgi:hypothetical protein